MRYDRPEVQEHLAAQAMLGMLSARVSRRLQVVAATRPALRRRLALWQQRGALLADGVAPLEASPTLWPAIEQRAGLAPSRTRVAEGLFGRWMLGLSGLALGAFVAGVVLHLMPQWVTDVETLAQAEQTLPQSYVGILAGADGRTLAWISSTRHGRRLFVKLADAVSLQAGEVLRVRALAPGRPPIDLGTLSPAKGLSELGLPQAAEALFKPVTMLEIVAFDASGSPRSIARGPCAKIW